MAQCEITEVKLGHFLTVLDSGYRRNPYHNSIHAADVMHSAFYFIHQKISFDSGRFAGRRFKSGRDVIILINFDNLNKFYLKYKESIPSKPFQQA